MFPGAEQVIEQQIAVRQVRLFAIQDEFALKPRFRRRCRGLATMVRLGRACRDECVGALSQRLADEEFKLARLVAAQGKAGLVIPLDQQLRTAKLTRETWK